MILRLALKEEKKHILMFFFIKIQIAVTFLVLAACVSVITSQYGIYRGFAELIDSEGQFIQSTFGVRVPDGQEGTVHSGQEILDVHIRDSEIAGTYHLLGTFLQDGSEKQWNAIVYDDELSEAYTPILEKGKWLKKRETGGWELRAVVSPNDYGIEAGDKIVFAPYDSTFGNIKVKICGKLKENSRVVSFQPSNDMVSYQNFLSTSVSEDGLPMIFLLKSDFDGLFSDRSIGEKMLWPAGMMFLRYKNDITQESIKLNEDFCKKYFDVRIMESLQEVKGKSLKYLKDQIMEVFPVLAASLFFCFLTTICVSALGTRYAVKNYIIYRILGLSLRLCKKIQLCINAILLSEGLLIALVSGILLNLFMKDGNIILNLGILQFGICFICGAAWLAGSFSIQKKMLKNPDYWRRKNCD